jgi:nicotinamide mononucleotide transporter
MIDQILEELSALHIVDYTGLVFGILYVYFATKERAVCWIFGGVSSLSIAYAGFFLYKLYSDAILNIIYFLMALWGLWNWYGSKQSISVPVSRMSRREHFIYLGLSLLLALPVAFLFSAFTNAALPWLDAITTTFALGATVLTILKRLENWIYWIIIDLVYIGIYYSQGAYLFALLFVIYVLLAIKGYVSWQQTYTEKSNLEQV